jgi:uncharacterized membrane protein YdjX (TVP38/TMEM64 family)
MGALRDHAVHELREADPGDRCRVLYPDVPGLGEGEMVNVHAKVMVVDDSFARVGSSNLANRSLGLDSECDLAFEARGREDLREAIASLRNDLLAEHLDTSPARVARELERTGSLVRTVDRLRREDAHARTLRLLELEASPWTADALETLGALDPEHPIPLEELVKRFEHEMPIPMPDRSPRWRIAGSLVVLAALAAAWHFTPLAAWVSTGRLAAAVEPLRDLWYGPLAVGGLFVIASLLLIPVTALTVATGLCLGPWLGMPVAWLSSIVAAAIGHLAGRLLWRDTVRRLAGRRLNALSRRLSRRGVLSTALIRIVPVAPFMIVNLVAGASHLRARDFVAGSAIGMLPGTVLLILTADAIRTAIAEPSGPAWLWSALAVLALLALAGSARRLAARGELRSR